MKKHNVEIDAVVDFLNKFIIDAHISIEALFFR